MKIAIHDNSSEAFFPNRWKRFCDNNGIEYKIVNAYDNNILDQCAGCDAFMWHFSNYDYKDAIFAKYLLSSLEAAGLKTFPNTCTSWHFDDKIAEKYLLEAIGAPIVPTYVFYSKKEALNFFASTEYPKVFKLRRGSGSSNVKLITNRRQAKRLIKKSFSRRGHPQINWFEKLKFRINAWVNGRENFLSVLKGVAWCIIGNDYDRMSSTEKGYIYIQEFIPNNTFDIRVCVVDGKAFALKRLCREGDFRASGGGRIIYDVDQIDIRCIKIALEIADKLHTQSMAFDFVFNEKDEPLIVEISYGFAANAYDKCEGYWTPDLHFHKGQGFDFAGWMVENVLKDENISR